MRSPVTSSALAALAATFALTACGSPLDAVSGGDWRSEERCRPQESPAPGDHPGDGPALSPEEILPDPAKCPEAYRGGGRSTAPAVGGPDPGSGAAGGGRGTARPPNPDHGCADGETVNGFPCTSVPGTGRVIYPDAPTEDRTPPAIPNY